MVRRNSPWHSTSCSLWVPFLSLQVAKYLQGLSIMTQGNARGTVRAMFGFWAKHRPWNCANSITLRSAVFLCWRHPRTDKQKFVVLRFRIIMQLSLFFSVQVGTPCVRNLTRPCLGFKPTNSSACRPETSYLSPITPNCVTCGWQSSASKGRRESLNCLSHKARNGSGVGERSLIPFMRHIVDLLAIH